MAYSAHQPLYSGRNNRPPASLPPEAYPLHEPEIDPRWKALFLQALGETVGLTRHGEQPFDLEMFLVCDVEVESLDRLIHATDSERKKAAWLATERYFDLFYPKD